MSVFHRLQDTISARAKSESGFSFVEIMVSIAIMGIAMGGLLSGWSFGISSSLNNKRSAQATSVATSAAEAVSDNTRNAYVDCATTYNPTQGIGTVPADYTISVGTILYWNGASFNATCNDTVSSFTKLQLIPVRVETTDGKVKRTFNVIKRGV